MAWFVPLDQPVSSRESTSRQKTMKGETSMEVRMKYYFTNSGILRVIAALLLGFASVTSSADEGVLELKTRTATYTNVTVTAKSDTNVYFKHAGGVSSIKVEELAPESQQSLGYVVAKSVERQAGKGSKLSGLRRGPAAPTQFIEVQFANGVILAAGDWEVHLHTAELAGIAIAWLVFCCCANLLCKKTGTKPGILIWFPILQLFPLLRAAGMSGWWFLALFIPVLNLIAWLGWCVNIVITRRKSLWWALLLILPGTNVTAFLYLALAKD
jgi:hypothetical protein